MGSFRLVLLLCSGALAAAPGVAAAAVHGSAPIGGGGRGHGQPSGGARVAPPVSSGPAQRPPSFGGRGVAPPVHAARPIPGSPGRPSVGSGWSGGSEPGYGYRAGFRGDRARGGRWFHGHHGDRLGWWLIYGDTWYPYAYPFSPYLEAAPSAPSDYWYWCESAQAYYPYVRVCPEGWELVVPSPQPDDWP